MIFYQKKQAGFSLVETLVAISILLIVIVGPMTISMQSAKSASFASEQVQAFFLAQEGLELAQKARDELLLGSTFFGVSGGEDDPWEKFSTNSGVYDYCLSVDGCGLAWDKDDSTSLADPVVDCTTDCLLYLKDPTTENDRSRFSHDTASAEKTPFTRRIYFERTGAAGDAVHVRSEVTWRTGSLVAEQKVEVDTYLYNIYDTN